MNKPILIDYLDNLKEIEHLSKLKYKYGKDDRIAWLKKRTDEQYRYFLKNQLQKYETFNSVFNEYRDYESYNYNSKYSIMNELSRLTGKRIELSSEGLTIY